MNETQEHIKSKIQEASNKIHQQTMRGSADVIFVSRRVIREIEHILDEKSLQHHTVVEGAGFVGPMAPCDIRAMAQMGYSEYELHEKENDEKLDDETAEKMASDPETGYDTAEEAKQAIGRLDIPEIEFKISDEEWVETHDITLEDELFE